jgi:hypothetical protein
MRVATSSGVVKRPVAMPAMTASRTSSGSFPVAAPTVSATPRSPSHRWVPTGPGETALTRIPLDLNS